LGFYTGSRPGVINKGPWLDSPTQAWIDLEAQIIYRRGRDEVDRATKRRPLCKLPTRLVAHLKRWRAADEKREAGAKARERDLKINAVIHHPNGAPFAGRVRTGFESIVRDAGLMERLHRTGCATPPPLG